MRVPAGKTIIVVLGAAVVAGGFFLLGHATADSADARARAYQSGHTDGYFDGLNAGQAQGLEEGRALQAANAAAADSKQAVQDAFTQGYLAGENDAFGSFDGGWHSGSPYLVTVEPGTAGSVYRISLRTLVAPNTDYHLCPDGHTICSAPRH